MNVALMVILTAAGFAIGVFCGVHLIGGWRQLRADLLRINREYVAVKAQMRAMDEGAA